MRQVPDYESSTQKHAKPPQANRVAPEQLVGTCLTEWVRAKMIRVRQVKPPFDRLFDRLHPPHAPLTGWVCFIECFSP